MLANPCLRVTVGTRERILSRRTRGPRSDPQGEAVGGGNEDEAWLRWRRLPSRVTVNLNRHLDTLPPGATRPVPGLLTGGITPVGGTDGQSASVTSRRGTRESHSPRQSDVCFRLMGDLARCS